MQVKPFTPDDAANAKKRAIHPLMIQAVNELLSEQYNPASGTVTLKQDEIIEKALQLFREEIGLSAMTEDEIFEYGWLDFEPLFEEAGWKVKYDRPGYCETYKAYYEFKRKK